MKIGLALGGGGAKGFAHIGVLKALEEAGIRADVIAGTSVGALVGAIHASGNLPQLEERACQISLTDIPMLLSPAWSLKGLFSGKNALELLSELVGVPNIEDLPVPFAAVSSDLNGARPVVLDRGDLRQAIRASISLPAVFTPVRLQDTLLVDGGVLEPVPVQCARERLGATFVIAVDLFGNDGASTALERKRLLDDLFPAGLMSALSYLKTLSAKLPWGNLLAGERERQPHIIDIIDLTLRVSQRHLTELRLKEHPADLVIQPAVTDVSLLDFHRGKPIIDRGVEATRAVLPELLAKLDAARGKESP